MTAQPVPADGILAQTLAAITRHEEAARAACNGGEGRWYNGWCPQDQLPEGETAGAGVSDERDRTIVYDVGRPSVAQSVHIALHDPESVLRRCAADRRLLAEHGPFSERDKGCKGCGLDNREELITGYYEDCPVILAIAEGYGLAEDGQQPSSAMPALTTTHPIHRQHRSSRPCHLAPKETQHEVHMYQLKAPGCPLEWFRCPGYPG